MKIEPNEQTDIEFQLRKDQCLGVQILNAHRLDRAHQLPLISREGDVLSSTRCRFWAATTKIYFNRTVAITLHMTLLSI